MGFLEWHGPKFLAFYVVFAAAMIGFAWMRVRWNRHGATGRLTEMTADPYRIAFLRAGVDEAIRVAVFNLVDRGLLRFNDESLRIGRADSEELAARALDKAILKACARGRTPAELGDSTGVRATAQSYRTFLVGKGLYASADEERARTWMMLASLALLVAIAAVKAVMAARQGLPVVWLLAAAAAASLAVARIWRLRATPRGFGMLDDLRTLVQRLFARRDSLRMGGETNEALLVAAVHGLHVLPIDNFPFLATLYPRRTNAEGEGSESIFDISSCGSSSSCGGSCGGGGCGGCGG